MKPMFFLLTALILTGGIQAQELNKVTIDAVHKDVVINRNIYGTSPNTSDAALRRHLGGKGFEHSPYQRLP